MRVITYDSNGDKIRQRIIQNVGKAKIAAVNDSKGNLITVIRSKYFIPMTFINGKQIK